MSNSRSPRRLVTVSWHDGTIRLRDGSISTAPLPVPDCPAGERYDVRLTSDWLVTRVDSGVAALRVRNGLTTDAVPLPPGVDDPGLRERFADPSGALIALAGDALHVLRPQGTWSSHPLPDSEVRVWCAALSNDGSPWIGGSPRRQRRTPELLRWSATGFSRDPLRLSLVDALRALVPDRFASIDGIEASGHPPVLFAHGADPSSTTSCLFVQTGRDRWHTIGLRGTVRALHRLPTGNVLVVTATGDLYELRGAHLHRLTSAAAICAHALHDAPSDALGIIRGSDAAGDEIAVVVGVYTAPPNHPLHWHRTVALRSTNGGATWSCVQSTSPAADEPELLDVALV